MWLSLLATMLVSTCPGELRHLNEPPAPVSRTVSLPELGLVINIPQNFRVVRRENGAVMVVHPADYERLRCKARGQRHLEPFYAETFYLLRADAVKRIIPALAEVSELWGRFSLSHLEGAVVYSGDSPQAVHTAAFMALHPYGGGRWVVAIVADCDCTFALDVFLDNLRYLDPIPLR